MPIGQYIITKSTIDLSWNEANALAAKLGGHLAAVTTAEEDTLIRGFLAKDSLLWNPEPHDNARNGPWIGLTQPAGSAEPGGGWKWTTGETYGYANWHALQPDNFINDNKAFYWDWNGAIGWADQVNDPVPAGYGAVKSAAIEFGTNRVALTGTRNHDFISGGDIANILNGRAGNDWIEGNAGGDHISGGAGADRLNGGAGKDFLTGGGGRDVLIGGADSDTFDFNRIADSGKIASTRDLIRDFVSGVDKIDLSGIDASKLAAGNQAFAFGGALAAGVVHAVQFDLAGTARDHTVVSGDVDGDHKADFQIDLKGLVALAETDFIL